MPLAYEVTLTSRQQDLRDGFIVASFKRHDTDPRTADDARLPGASDSCRASTTESGKMSSGTIPSTEATRHVVHSGGSDAAEPSRSPPKSASHASPASLAAAAAASHASLAAATAAAAAAAAEQVQGCWASVQRCPGDSHLEMILPLSTRLMLRDRYRLLRGDHVRLAVLLNDLDLLAGSGSSSSSSSSSSTASSRNSDVRGASSGGADGSSRDGNGRDGSWCGGGGGGSSCGCDRTCGRGCCCCCCCCSGGHCTPLVTQDMKLAGQVTWTGSSALEVTVEISSRRSSAGSGSGADEWGLVGIARFQLVARSTERPGPAQVPPMGLSSETDVAFHDAGQARQEKRRRLKSSTKTGTSAPPPPMSGSSSAVACQQPQPQYSSSRTLTSHSVSQWQDRNPAGRIFGGFLLQLCLEHACTLARLLTGVDCMPCGVLGVVFLQAVEIGKLLRVDAALTQQAPLSSSLHFDVTLYAADSDAQLASSGAACVTMTVVIARPAGDPGQLSQGAEFSSQASTKDVRSRL
ncbi:MAG: hypothetical protein WDW38_008804 [Sanguina aurantia]